jgi:O-antigen/teichoic acid export membrane protein
VFQGMAWNAGYQAFAAIVQFAAMLIVVRIVSPAEYGLWAVAIGVLQLLNIVNVASFAAHALQLRPGEEPDWTLHWHVGNLLQATLCIVCLGVGLALRGAQSYQGVSPLLYIASLGLLLNTPAQIRTVMLQRRLDYRRLRMIAAISSLFGTAVIVLGAMAGLGARAMVLGGNVLGSLPFLLDLLLVEKWRPNGNWFAWPDLPRYRASLVFGTNRAMAGLLASSRGALGAALLPSTLGLEAVGLMNRAEGLLATSAGRVLGLVSETVYPILPQIAGEEERFGRVARAYCLLMTTFAFAAFALFAGCGRDLSRVLYGAKWSAADPLLLPGSVIGLGTVLATVGGQVLLAQGRLREVFILDLAPRLLFVPAFVGVLAFDWGMVAFHWGVAAPLILMALVEIALARRRLPGGSRSGELMAPVVAAAVGWLGVMVVGSAVGQTTPGPRLSVGILAFAITWLTVLRVFFPRALLEMLNLLPRGATLKGMLRYRATMDLGGPIRP